MRPGGSYSPAKVGVWMWAKIHNDNSYGEVGASRYEMEKQRIFTLLKFRGSEFSLVSIEWCTVRMKE